MHYSCRPIYTCSTIFLIPTTIKSKKFPRLQKKYQPNKILFLRINLHLPIQFVWKCNSWEGKYLSIPKKNIRVGVYWFHFSPSLLRHTFSYNSFFCLSFPINILYAGKNKDKIYSFFSRPNKIVVDSSWKMLMKIEKYEIYLLYVPP